MFDLANAAKRNVTLYTSIPPTMERSGSGRDIGAAYQKACIDSWRRLGFDVASLNSRSEIDVLSKAGYDLTFHEVTSKRPRILDFLETIRNSEQSIAGIINADCLLFANDGAISSLIRAAENGMVLVERMNLRAEDAQVTGVSCSGFDLFCFETETLCHLKFDEEISIGTPWWDYWFPLAYQQAGSQLFALSAPLLMHLDHPQNWSQQSWITQGRRMHAALSQHPAAAVAFPFLRYECGDELADRDVECLATESFKWLKTNPALIEVEDPNTWFLLSLLSGIDRVARELIARDMRLMELNGMLAERDARILAMEESVSWKLTRPIRAMSKKLGVEKDGQKMLR